DSGAGQVSYIFADFNGDGLPDALGYAHVTSPVTVSAYMNRGVRSGDGQDKFILGTIATDSAQDLARTAWIRIIRTRDCEEYLPAAISCFAPINPQNPDEATPFPVEGDPGIRVADFNGDGRDDLLSFSNSNGGVHDPFSNTDLGSVYDPDFAFVNGKHVQILLGANSGIGPHVEIATDTGATVWAGGPTGDGIPPQVFNRVLDVNGDGLPDFVSVQPSNPTNLTDWVRADAIH